MWSAGKAKLVKNLAVEYQKPAVVVYTISFPFITLKGMVDEHSLSDKLPTAKKSISTGFPSPQPCQNLGKDGSGTFLLATMFGQTKTQIKPSPRTEG